MKRLLMLLFLLTLVCLCGCRVADFGKSTAKTQKESVKGLLYMDSLYTDDGLSRLDR